MPAARDRQGPGGGGGHAAGPGALTAPAGAAPCRSRPAIRQARQRNRSAATHPYRLSSGPEHPSQGRWPARRGTMGPAGGAAGRRGGLRAGCALPREVQRLRGILMGSALASRPVVRGRSEQHQRDPRIDRRGGAVVDTSAEPAPVEHRHDHAVGGAGGQQRQPGADQISDPKDDRSPRDVILRSPAGTINDAAKVKGDVGMRPDRHGGRAVPVRPTALNFRDLCPLVSGSLVVGDDSAAV